jgi:hypothetical protein
MRYAPRCHENGGLTWIHWNREEWVPGVGQVRQRDFWIESRITKIGDLHFLHLLRSCQLPNLYEGIIALRQSRIFIRVQSVLFQMCFERGQSQYPAKLAIGIE